MSLFRRAALGIGLLALGFVPLAHAETEHATVALPAPVVLFMSVFVAEDYFWPKEGLDIKIIYLPGVASMNAVIAGSAEFSLSSGGSLTRAAAHGQRLLAIANLNQRSGQFITIRKDLADAVIRVALNAAGFDSEKDATIAPMQPPDILAAFARGSIDAFSLGPPFAQQVVHDGQGVIVMDGTADDPPGYSPMASSIVVTRPDICTQRKSLCEKMGHSLLEASQFIHDHLPESVAVLKKRFATLDEAVLTSAAEAVIRMTGTPPALSDAGLANGDRMNAEAGFLKPEDQVKSYDGLYTNVYLR